MKVSLEEAACVALAVTLIACLVTWQALIVPCLVATFAVWEGLTSILGTFAIAGTGIIAIVRMPHRWYYRIIYDSTSSEKSSTSSKDASSNSSDDFH